MSCFQIKSKKYNLENTSHTKMCVSRIFYEVPKIPLTFTAEEVNSTLKIQQNNSAPTLNLEYKLNNSGWTPYTQENTITLANVGDKVQMRATEAGNSTFSSNTSNYNRFIMTGKIAASGNIQSLLDQTMTRMDVPAYCYYYMFSDCTSLTQAPELPATTLANSCYQSMFSSCTSLVQAPELPATTLADSCYYRMFGGCSSLTQALELPATTLDNCCYYLMFFSCSSLTQAPELPATTLANSCYSGMFNGCTSLVQAPFLPATTLADSCYYAMFYNCTNITSVTMKSAVKPYNSISYGYLDGNRGYKISINYVD